MGATAQAPGGGYPLGGIDAWGVLFLLGVLLLALSVFVVALVGFTT